MARVSRSFFSIIRIEQGLLWLLRISVAYVGVTGWFCKGCSCDCARAFDGVEGEVSMSCG